MTVPPLFPEPITVSGNAAESDYDTRLAFIRRVIRGQFLAFAFVTLVATQISKADGRLESILAYAVIVMAVLHFTRRFGRGGWLDRWFGASLFFLLLVILGWAGATMKASGWPVAVLPAVSALIWVYSVLAGRDFSFVGQFSLPALVLGLTMAGGVGLHWISLETAQLATAMGLPFLGFLVYDLAMILKRRRPDEVALSVVDLFRDPLNFTTYGVRVWRHWQRVKI